MTDGHDDALATELADGRPDFQRRCLDLRTAAGLEPFADYQRTIQDADDQGLIPELSQ